ncbi:hypothetical protein WL01_20155 [Burkholderia ubonensis]|uniref:hypothetical protein n=1 Tax=Burkholderia ubonensis TaxID=101571 RepID=UPI00075A96B0|nr:hypothetical protein [Burkholderia ubonensis]KVX13068.1 hypothetical protein WL01_20155 [Burkholderia ubonensis]KWB13616.1 hypothetical protein WL33_11740 [Burkholderia ubonensis]
MAWYELDEWDALGAAGEGVKQTLVKVATHVEQFSANMTRLSADAAARAEYARLMWQNLDELSNAMIRGLDSVDRSRLDAQLIARVEAMRTELGKMRSFAAIAAEADTVAKGMLGIGAQLGGLISAAQLLGSSRIQAPRHMKLVVWRWAHWEAFLQPLSCLSLCLALSESL